MIDQAISIVLVSAVALPMAAWCGETTVLRKLTEAAPHLNIAHISGSPVAGIHEVEIKEDLSRLYVTEDGNFLFAGDVYAVSTDGLVNLTERRRTDQRRELLGNLVSEDMIVFAPKAGTEEIVYVFTDVDCGFCRKLHQDIDQLNGLGIEVRYLAFPRGGPGTPTYDKMVSIWCADEPREAITAAKLGETVADVSCDSPVPEQYALGRSLHFGGTPTMFTERGELIAGYLVPDELARQLGLP
ncbi:MAG: DsbC family protein [Gammaproteobacteria bacterium]|nr:DsbC family protein [Gammaproteobacteria bacterium]